MAKVTAVACDNTGCDSIAKADDSGVPASWALVNVTQGGRKVVTGAVFCSTTCMATYMQEVGGLGPAKRRRRTKEQMEADRLTAEANGDSGDSGDAVPDSGTEAELTSNA
jgi:hypothetical protein